MNQSAVCPRSDRGFTIMELAFVLMLIGILALVALASFSNSSDRAAEATCLANQRTLSTAITMYRSQNAGAAPASFDDLEPYARDVGTARFCPLDGTTELVIDDTTDQVTCPNH